MRGVVQLGIVLCCALIVIGVGVMSVNRVQNAARLSMCRSNLKSLGVGVLASNVMFADASVRPLTAAVSPQVLEALATIAGGEQVDGMDTE